MKRFQLTTCSVKECNRTARHWVRFCASRPQRRQPVCHRCYKSVIPGPNNASPVLNAILVSLP